jgi:hypothetical protein
MDIRLGLISLATGTLLLAAVSGCGSSDHDPPSTTHSSLSTPSDTTTSASPKSPSNKATADATEAMRNYYRLLDEVRSRSGNDLQQLQSVATGTQLQAMRTLIRRQQHDGQRQTGSTAISDLKVQSVNLDNSDPSAGKVPTVVIDVCWDVSKVDFLDKDGKSIVSPNRPDTGWTRYTVANYKYAADPSGGWRVATGQDLKQTPCAAS